MSNVKSWNAVGLDGVLIFGARKDEAWNEKVCGFRSSGKRWVVACFEGGSKKG